jgi:hopanoid C-3 methylase
MVVRPRPPVQNVRFTRTMRFEPLELEYIATALAEHEILLLDGVADRRRPFDTARRLAPDVVLFTGYVTDVGTILRAAADLRRLAVPPLVYVGGVHAEVMPHHFYSPNVDGVFFADQINGVRALLAALARGERPVSLPGAALRTEEDFVARPAATTACAHLPAPTRTLFARAPDTYRYFHYHGCAVVKTSFGCPNRCTFCFCRKMNGGRYSTRSVTEVVEEIAALPASTIFLVDDNFLVDTARIEEFCTALRERGVSKDFIAYAGAHFIAQHPASLERLRTAGLRGLCVGLEFVTDPALAAVGKPASLADNDATVALCRKLDIDLFALFIVDPRWHTSDFQTLARYLRGNRISFAAFATMTPLPGIDGVPDPARNTPLDRISWWRYDLLRLHERPAHMPAAAYYLWLYYLYLLPALQPATLTRLLPRCGIKETLRLSLASAVTGIEYLAKLLIWR